MERLQGTLDIEYHRGRKTKRSLVYRLQRRTFEVIQSIKKYYPLGIGLILDIGAADGLMLSRIKSEFPEARCVGLEYSKDLIAANKDKAIEMIRGDARDLPFGDESFHIAVAAAVIEHIASPLKMLREAYRVLVGGGILILTTPDPFWNHLATAVGHLAKGQHSKTMNLRELQDIFKKVDLRVLETNKFMLSPIGIPLEFAVEKLVRSLDLMVMFANQLIVGKKM